MGDTKSASWFESDDALVAELRRTVDRIPSTVSISGYDEFKEIARGGQGVVYSAIQRSTRRRVAVKVMLDGALASGASRRRFEREIELVAALKHPAIVGVYDSGMTSDGQLYLVMEYVEGQTLDQALMHAVPDDGNSSPAAVADAVRIVADIAEAVQYAHQRGVIHRDLKPNNILVDAEGGAHILDFGLAKATDTNIAESIVARPTLSVTGQFMGSLPWSSPEQAVGDPDAIDSRTDIYSLGVMLYQLLTGRFPYDVSGGLKTTLDHIASSAPVPPRSLRAEISEDLATVLTRSLAKERERRYQSAGDLAADLRAYLAGEPIAARRDSAWYTLSRTVRRYQIAAFAGAVVVLVSTGALVVSLRALDEATAQRKNAEFQTTEATKQAQRAGAFSKFVTNILTAANPGLDSKDLKVIDVLDDASETADQTLANQPEARMSVRSLLSTAYRNLGEYDKSLHEADLGMDILKDLGPAPTEETLRLKTARAAVLMDLNDIDEALPLATRTSEESNTLFGPDNEVSIEADATLSAVYDVLEDFDKAESTKRDVFARSERVFGQDSREALTAAGNLGHTLYAAGKVDEAITLIEDVVERSERAFGKYDITTMAPMSTLSNAYDDKGYYDKGAAMKKDLWERFAKAYGDDNATTLILASNYANSLYTLDRYEEGLPIALNALDGIGRTLGEDHPNYIRATTMVTSFYKGLGRLEDALAMETKTINTAVRTLGASSTLVGYLRNNVSTTYRKLGQYDRAEEELRVAIAECAPSFPPQHSMHETFQYNLAVTIKDHGKKDEAIGLLRSAADGFLEKLGPDSDWTIDAFKELIELLESEGKSDEAASWKAELPPSG
ncbi:MAG: serine/threonine protein kinase [Phycisphaeraceae bacterium]|nr:serine/threonine protein kinase [Phycisphaerales bacterium]MCB9859665.1 serine/threonine protein kinase [Phycisphaeraceae bacterium]